MLIKTGDAEIIDVVDDKKTNDSSKRKDALAEALDKAKQYISVEKKDKHTKGTEN